MTERLGWGEVPERTFEGRGQQALESDIPRCGPSQLLAVRDIGQIPETKSSAVSALCLPQLRYLEDGVTMLAPGSCPVILPWE